MHLTLLAHHKQDYVGEDPPLGRILQMFSTHGRRYATRLNEFTDPLDLQSAGTIAVIAARLDGAYRRAEQLGSWVDSKMAAQASAALLPWSAQHVSAKPGWLSTQRGLTETLSGDLDYAVRLYTRGFSEAGRAPLGHFAGANAAANLALIAAMRGHFDLARLWIERMEGLGPLPDWIEHLTALGAKISAALIAVEEGDPALAKHHLDRIGPVTQHVELWPFILHVRATYEACYGDPYKGLAELEAARLTHGTLSVTDHGTTHDLLVRTEAKLVLRTHNAARVLYLAQENAEDFPQQFAAWAHLYAGHPHRAIRAANRALNQKSRRLPLSDVIELHIVLAVSQLRNGHTDRAIEEFLAALAVRTSAAHVKPFLLAPRDEIAYLAELSHAPDPLQSLPRELRPNSLYPITIVELTPREHAVLRSLDHGETAVEAAQKFGVTPATVRSQVSSIYRKLGVSGRAAALARASDLGLLTENRHSRRRSPNRGGSNDRPR